MAAISSRFEAAGVGALLLKGASLAQWLHRSDDPRGYIDCDLLIAPAHAEAGREILLALGYRLTFDDRSMPSWWREHATTWVREDDGVAIDLHRTLDGVGVDDQVAWTVLSRDRSVVMVAGQRVPALGLPARALHVALHAAHHGAEWHVPITDLERALAKADEGLWRQAAALADELAAVEAFAAGLRLTPAGAQLAAALELPPPGSVRVALRAATPPPVALGFDQLASAKSARERLEIAWRKLVPPPAFIRQWAPGATEGRAALVRAYLRRPLWLLRRAPSGYRAWREARRSVRAGGPSQR